MPVPTDYISGTITLTNGSDAFSGVGTGWLAADFREGDSIVYIEGGEDFAPPIIQSIISNTSGTLTSPWVGPTLSSVNYRMRYQWDSSRVSAQSRLLIEQLGNGNITSFSGLEGPGVPVFNGPHSLTIKPEQDFINGIAYNVQVDTLADRDAYDGQSQGFSVLVSNIGDGRSALYSKNSNSSGDWSDPAFVTGPIGPVPVIEATVQSISPGLDPVVNTNPITGGVSLDFELPQAEGFYWLSEYDSAEEYLKDSVVRFNGTSFIATQVAPIGEEPSSASPPIDNTYWDVLAQRGNDGNIDGVTSFWHGRITVDTDAAEARDGLSVLSYEFQSLNPVQKTQAQQNLELEPGVDIPTIAQFNTLATKVDVRRQRIVNGDKLVSQEHLQTAGTANGRYISDQNAMYFVSSAGTFTGVNVLTLSPAGGYRDQITITVADASLAAGEYLLYRQNLEGSNVRDLKWGTADAVDAVARFGFRGPAGTYAYRLGNSAGDRSFVALFTISAPEANTDTVQTIAIPGDTTGTWLNTDGVIGITRDIVLACGSTFQGTTGWQGGLIYGTSGVSNGMGTGAAVFQFFDEGFKADPDATGVYGVYEANVTDAVYRSERYRVSDSGLLAYGSALSSSSNFRSWAFPFPVRMCKKPTVTATLSSGAFVDASTAQTLCGNVNLGNATGSVSLTAYVADARLS